MTLHVFTRAWKLLRDCRTRA